MATAVSVPPGLTHLDVWGQLLDGDWELRLKPAQLFLTNIAAATSHAALQSSFPLWPLRVRAASHHFYEVYGIDWKP